MPPGIVSQSRLTQDCFVETHHDRTCITTRSCHCEDHVIENINAGPASPPNLVSLRIVSLKLVDACTTAVFLVFAMLCTVLTCLVLTRLVLTEYYARRYKGDEDDSSACRTCITSQLCLTWDRFIETHRCRTCITSQPCLPQYRCIETRGCGILHHLPIPSHSGSRLVDAGPAQAQVDALGVKAAWRVGDWTLLGEYVQGAEDSDPALDAQDEWEVKLGQLLCDSQQR